MSNRIHLCSCYVAGRTCLHYAAGYGFEQALDVLLSKKGVEVGMVDNKGDTPLHLAAVQGHPMCAFNLTKTEPRGCLKANKAGQSPLDMAMACDRGEVSAYRRSQIADLQQPPCYCELPWWFTMLEGT